MACCTKAPGLQGGNFEAHKQPIVGRRFTRSGLNHYREGCYEKKYVFILTIVLISLLATSRSLAWFSANKEATNEFKMGTVGVEVVENSFKNITDVKIQSYDKAVSVKSLGTKRTYVRVRLIPLWSDHNLPVSMSN